MIEPSKNSSQQRQHFVSRTYLKRFVKANNKVAVIDLLLDNKEFFVGLDSICIEKGINDLSPFIKRHNTPIPADLIEQLHSEVENQYNIHMAKSLDQDKLPAKDESYQAFGLFVVHQLCRTPKFRSLVYDYINSHLPQKVEFSTISFAVIAKIIADYKLLDNATFTIIKAAEGSRFIASDNPASAWLNDGNFWTVYHPPVNSFWLRKLKFICPLSPRYLLSIDPYNSYVRHYAFQQANADLVESFNSRVRLTASRFLIT